MPVRTTSSLPHGLPLAIVHLMMEKELGELRRAPHEGQPCLFLILIWELRCCFSLVPILPMNNDAWCRWWKGHLCERSTYGKDLHKAQCAKDRFLLIFKASFTPCPYPMHLCVIAVLAHKLLMNCSVGSSSFRCQVIHEQHGSFHLEMGTHRLNISVCVPERENRYLQGVFSTFWGLVWQCCWQFWYPSLLFFLSAVGQAQIYLVENITGQHPVGFEQALEHLLVPQLARPSWHLWCPMAKSAFPGDVWRTQGKWLWLTV